MPWSQHMILPRPSPRCSSKFRREYKFPMQKTPHSQIHILLLRHIFWFGRMYYTVNNSKLGIAVQQQKKYGLHFSSTSINPTKI